MALFAPTRQKVRSPGIRPRGLIAALCILLVLLVGAAGLLHLHADGSASEAGCSLCAVAHLHVLATPEAAHPVVLEVLRTLAVPAHLLAASYTLQGPSLIRPPPGSILIAHA